MWRVQRHLRMLWWPPVIAHYTLRSDVLKENMLQTFFSVVATNKMEDSVSFFYVCFTMILRHQCMWKHKLKRPYALFCFVCDFACVRVSEPISFVMIALRLSPGGQAAPLDLRVFANLWSQEKMACSSATVRAWTPCETTNVHSVKATLQTHSLCSSMTELGNLVLCRRDCDRAGWGYHLQINQGNNKKVAYKAKFSLFL